MSSPSTDPRPRGALRALLLAAAVIALFACALAFGLAEKLAEMRQWIETCGALAPLAFVAIYIAATVAAIPGTPMTVAAGAMFGTWLGTALVSAASTIGAALSFLIARYLARDYVHAKLGRSTRFQRLQGMTARQGAVAVAVSRLVPLFPFNLLNYGFGLTRIPFWTYLFWSWLCMLPGTLLYVGGTDAVAQITGGGEFPWLTLGLVAIALLVVWAVATTRRRSPS